ncbi:MAG: endolytic transglycosylase MltG [Clostridia bacterium]|nr:endolytic transglycosylase MltG [Clostridia bacterium]
MNVMIVCQKSSDDPTARGIESAKRIADALRGQGIRVFVDWFSPKKFRDDKQLHDRCLGAVEQADALILIAEDDRHLKRTRAYRIWEMFEKKAHAMLIVYALQGVQTERLPRALRDRFIVFDEADSARLLAQRIAMEKPAFREHTNVETGRRRRAGRNVAAVIAALLLIPVFLFLFSLPSRKQKAPEPAAVPEVTEEAPSTPRPVMDVTLIEGMKAEAMADKLESELAANGGVFSADRFLELCNDPETFADYPFVQDLIANEKTASRYYALEGYLFPDTYTFYVDTDEETVIRKMLDRFLEITARDAFSQDLAQSGMTLDEAVTLASVIEREGTGESFTGISAVLHNRLDQEMMLQCDSTAQYAGAEHRLATTIEDVSIDSPYNTYKVTGLPVGPIANPGEAALLAAVAPDADKVAEGYLYFALTDPATGVIAFSKTYEEHLAVVEQYGDLWEQWDQQH